jgi:hypothetical protein
MSRFEHHRAYFRIKYPKAVRPVFAPAGQAKAAPVVDCCERGFRFALSDGTLARAVTGAPVEGELRFRDGGKVTVRGVIVRVQGGEAAVHLDAEPIPFKRILSEQMFLRRRYPHADFRAVA